MHAPNVAAYGRKNVNGPFLMYFLRIEAQGERCKQETSKECCQKRNDVARYWKHPLRTTMNTYNEDVDILLEDVEQI